MFYQLQTLFRIGPAIHGSKHRVGHSGSIFDSTVVRPPASPGLSQALLQALILETQLPLAVVLRGHDLFNRPVEERIHEVFQR